MPLCSRQRAVLHSPVSCVRGYAYRRSTGSPVVRDGWNSTRLRSCWTVLAVSYAYDERSSRSSGRREWEDVQRCDPQDATGRCGQNHAEEFANLTLSGADNSGSSITEKDQSAFANLLVNRRLVDGQRKPSDSRQGSIGTGCRFVYRSVSSRKKAPAAKA